MTTKLPPVNGKLAVGAPAESPRSSRPVSAPQESFESKWAGLIGEDGYPEEVIGAPEEREWR